MDKFIFFTGDPHTDTFLMFDILEQINFDRGATSSSNRIKMNGGVNPMSMCYGYTFRGYMSPTKMRQRGDLGNYFFTGIREEEPDLNLVFREYAKLYFPDHYWTSVQMNKNFKCLPHKDSANVGESVLCSFGDFTGGQTYIQPDGEEPIKIDSRTKPAKFNGAKILHWVEDFIGTRYSLVFFNHLPNIKKCQAQATLPDHLKMDGDCPHCHGTIKL